MTLSDAAVREKAERDSRASYLVEASAGTGKTTTLIRRIVRLVLRDGVPLREIAAMTFTEKAAGEMKTRLRSELDEILSREKAGESRDRTLRAAVDLDAAEISTIHSFCARLLRERPVEAELDPDFVAGDERLAADLADEVFRGWFDRAARVEPGPVADALRRGAQPGDIAELASELHRNRLLLSDATVPVDAASEIRESAGYLLAGHQRVISLLSSNENSKKRSRVEDVVAELQKVAAASDEALLALSPSLAVDLHGKWPDEAKEAIRGMRPGIDLLEELLSGFPLVPILTALVEEIRASFFREIESAKRRDGILDFDDLLLKARDLLRTSRAAREHFLAKYRTLVVDEFQDTDPVQAEIVMRLAAAPERQDGPWTDLTPEPGRLFLVGDPKQSIYRFRRADIETYAEARNRFSADRRLLLTSNFRSVQPLLDFVNAVGPTLLPDPAGRNYAVGYAPLSPWDRTKEGTRPAVLYLAPPEPDTGPGAGSPSARTGPDPEDGEDPEIRAQEARAVANLLRTRFGRGERPWSRIAILVPRHDTVELLEEALREAGIPYVLEGGKSFYRREEVAAVLEALKAIDDPSDGVAVVATLKSLLFGFSDRDLLDAVESGIRLDRLAEIPAASPLAGAAALLLRLHRERHRRPMAATLADLFASRQTLAAVENGAVLNPLQGLSNLERISAFARDADLEGLSFRQTVQRFVRLKEDEAFEPSAFAEESDAVRLMTLYKAKGLEFDVVVLADFGLKARERGGPRPSVLVERAGGRLGVSLAFGSTKARTARFAAVQEADRLRRDEEVRRLLYVGLTRAKETLVVSWFRRRTVKKGGDVKDTLDQSLLSPLAAFEVPSGPLASLVEVVAADVSRPERRVAAAAKEERIDIAAEMAAAELRLERVRAAASRPLRRAGEKDPSRPITHEDTEPADREEAPDRARRIGVAVHAAMEMLLGRSGGPDAATIEGDVRRACEDLFEDERREAAGLVDRLLSAPVVSRAFAARRRFVELPLLYLDETPAGPFLVEGKIDLLFEDPDGWQIVDWKTDRVDSEADQATRETLYAPQLRAYETGLGKLLGPAAAVKPGLLVFARALRA